MNKLLIACLLAGSSIIAPVTTAAAAQAQPPAVIVIVNMDKVFTDSAAGRAAQVELKTKLSAIQTRVQQLRASFGADEQSLIKARPAQNAPAAAIAAWEAKTRDFQTRKSQAEQELSKRNQEFQSSRQYVVKQIKDAADPIITQVMQERGASIALPESATLQHSTSIEVTSEVIARLDKTLPHVATTPPAGS